LERSDVPAPGAQVVYCLPHAGGGAHNYLALGSAIAVISAAGGAVTSAPGAFDWSPLDYAGRFTRDDEAGYPAFSDAVDDLAARISADARGRTIGLFGHSLGGSLAYEIGRRLADDPAAPVVAIAVSSAEPPSAGTVTAERFFDLDDDEFLDHLLNLGNPPVADPRRRQLLADALPLIRADYRLHHSFRPCPDASVDVPLHIFFGADEPIAESLSGWTDHSSAPVTFRRFSGGHFYWQRDLAGLGTELRRVFSGADAFSGADGAPGRASTEPVPYQVAPPCRS
jgi:surfactin synthase thioesterase subunit